MTSSLRHALALGLFTASFLAGCPQPEESAADRQQADSYIDLDGDGFFVNAANEADVDCADGDATINPGATEVCDRKDNDCSGVIDDNAEGAFPWYPDTDGDGYGIYGAQPAFSCTKPEGYTGNDDDCNDEFANIYPSAPERCNGKDDNCNILVDEGFDQAAEWFVDLDRDGFGGGEPVARGCSLDPTWVSNADDCNDVRKGVNPEAPEICDGVDNDCDENVDDEDTNLTGALQFFADTDDDGYGNILDPIIACVRPADYVENALDCDDEDPERNPQSIWYMDNDRDGFGVADPRWVQRQCWQPIGYAMNTDDCDDSDPVRFDATVWHPDADRDGFGGAQTVGTGCQRVDGWTTDSADCNDRDATISPLGTEICDRKDNDCDTLTDDADDVVSGQSVWFRDGDADTYGVAFDTKGACARPTGYVNRAGDCNDSEAILNPTTEWWRDADRDGYGDPTTPWPTPQCAVVPGYMPNEGDCDDSDYFTSDLSWWFADGDGDGQGTGFTPAFIGCATNPALVRESGDCDDTDINDVGGFCYGDQVGRVTLTIDVDSEPRGSEVRLICGGQAPFFRTLNVADANDIIVIDRDVPADTQCRVEIRRPNGDASGDGAAQVSVTMCGADAGLVSGSASADINGPGFMVSACSGCTDPTADNYDANAIISTPVCFNFPEPGLP
jgi:hypothetical protein